MRITEAPKLSFATRTVYHEVSTRRVWVRGRVCFIVPTIPRRQTTRAALTGQRPWSCVPSAETTMKSLPCPYEVGLDAKAWSSSTTTVRATLAMLPPPPRGNHRGRGARSGDGRPSSTKSWHSPAISVVAQAQARLRLGHPPKLHVAPPAREAKPRQHLPLRQHVAQALGASSVPRPRLCTVRRLLRPARRRLQQERLFDAVDGGDTGPLHAQPLNKIHMFLFAQPWQIGRFAAVFRLLPQCVSARLCLCVCVCYDAVKHCPRQPWPRVVDVPACRTSPCATTERVCSGPKSKLGWQFCGVVDL